MIAVREAWHVARMTNIIASHALAVAVASEADQVPEWVQIFPAGPDLPARDGRRFTLHDPQAVIAASMDTSVDLMVDVEHASETRPKQGLDAPAVGWIKALEERAGAIWGRVEWTTQGSVWVASRAYRYFSPTFYHDEAGEILALKSAALVNNPAFETTALACAENIQTEKQTMDKSVLDALGLAATASAADAVTAIATLKGEVQTATARANSPDPAQYVAKAQYDATAWRKRRRRWKRRRLPSSKRLLMRALKRARSCPPRGTTIWRWRGRSGWRLFVSSSMRCRKSSVRLTPKTHRPPRRRG